MADDDGNAAIFSRLRNVDGTFQNADRPAQKEFASFRGECVGRLDG
jgi:hypothetical protein